MFLVTCVGCWKIPQAIGRPGPRCGHSMVVVDKYRAAMFGGILGESAFSELYILDMETNVRLMCFNMHMYTYSC